MKLFLKVALACILIAAGIWLFADMYRAGNAQENTAAAEVMVTRGTIQSVVTAQGTLEPKEYVDVGAQISGLVEKMHFDIGDTVSENDLIAEIDPDVYDARVKEDQARLKALQAQQLEQEALVKQARQKLDRYRKLLSARAVSEETYQDAETTLEVARAGLLSLAAQIEEQQSTLEGDETNLSYTKIYAPMAGTVVDKAVEEGQTINANQTTPTIVQIADLDTMTVKAQVAEADVMKLQPGMDSYFTTLGSGTREWHGTVRQILPTPETENDVVLYSVLIDVPNHDRVLMTGMTTQVFFIVAQAVDAPLVPVSALRRRVPDADTDDGLAYEIEIKGKGLQTIIVSVSDRQQAAVASGLDVGDTVLLGSASSAAAQGQGGFRRGGMARI
tara:strand:- start:443 stop:1606 length:1164 start_codon:yes stop_codon:yes gene_type:complete